MDELILVIDQGTLSTRAMVFDSSGNCIKQQSQAVRLNQLTGDQVEQDPEELFQSILWVLKALAQNLPATDIQRLSKVAFVSQRSSIVACQRVSADDVELDVSSQDVNAPIKEEAKQSPQEEPKLQRPIIYKPLSPIISWLDTRNKTVFENINDQTLVELKQRTGLRLNSHVGAAKMQALLQELLQQPELQELAAKQQLLLTSSASYLLGCVCENNTAATMDAVIAQRMYLTEFGAMAWNEGLLQRFGLTKNLLPAIVSSEHCYGVLPEHLGLGALPVSLLGGDQNFLTWAYGEKAQHDGVFVNVGTGAFIQAVFSTQTVPEQLLKTSVVINAPQPSTDMQAQSCIAEATVNNAGAALQWWQKQSGLELTYELVAEVVTEMAVEKEVETTTEISAEVLPKKTQQISQEHAKQQTIQQKAIKQDAIKQKNIPVFINRVSGTGSPLWLDAGESYFLLNGKRVEPLAELNNAANTLAVLESIAFGLQLNLELLKQVKPELVRVYISGGVAGFDYLCQVLATVSGLEVVRCEDREASARGVAAYLFRLQRFAGLDAADVFAPEEGGLLLERYGVFRGEMDLVV